MCKGSLTFFQYVIFEINLLIFSTDLIELAQLVPQYVGGGVRLQVVELTDMIRLVPHLSLTGECSQLGSVNIRVFIL